MESIAPCSAAADWDNVGLLVGDPGWRLRRLLLTIDLTAAVLDEAIRAPADAILSYHPPIFRPGKRMIVDRGTAEGIAAEALSHRIAVYSPHTALDAAGDGTNDTLAGLAGLEGVEPFATSRSAMEQCKLVVFVPESHVDRVAEAAFAAGAGRIGAYERCSFRIGGQGSFFGTDATDPVVGRKGRLERVDEVRLEVVLRRSDLVRVSSAVRSAHPYEEPAYDVYALEPAALLGVGQGRVGRFRRSTRLAPLARLLKRRIGATVVSLIGRSTQTVRRGLVCVGAAGSLPFDLSDSPGPGDVIITGEIRHHDALRIQRCGAAAIALGHWASERPVLRPLAKRLSRALPGTTVSVSRADRDPFSCA